MLLVNLTICHKVKAWQIGHIRTCPFTLWQKAVLLNVVSISGVASEFHVLISSANDNLSKSPAMETIPETPTWKRVAFQLCMLDRPVFA